MMGGGPRPLAGAAEMIERLADKLVSPQVIEKLRLDDDQIHKIRQAVAEHREKLAQARERIGAAIRDAGPDKREELIQKAKDRGREIFGGLRERIGQILRPDQREQVQQMFRPEGG